MRDKPKRTFIIRPLPEGQRPRRCEVGKGCGGTAAHYAHLPGGLRLACQACARRLRA
jgi:hypothetical protein